MFDQKSQLIFLKNNFQSDSWALISSEEQMYLKIRFEILHESPSSITQLMLWSVVVDERRWLCTELVRSEIKDELLGTIRSIIVAGNFKKKKNTPDYVLRLNWQVELPGLKVTYTERSGINVRRKK